MSSSVPSASIRPLTDRRSLGPWFLAEFLISYASMLLLTGCYDYAEIKLGATPSQRLWISAAWGLAYIFISLLAGRITGRLGPRRAAATFATLSIFTCLAGLTVIVFPRLWLVPLVMLLVNCTTTTIWPALESGLTRSPGRLPLSQRLSLYNIAWGSAGFLATFTHGMLENLPLGDGLGGRLPFATIFVVAALACGLAAVTLGVFAVPAHRISIDNVPDTAAGEHEMEDPSVRRRAQLLLKMAWIANALSYVAIYVLIPVMTQLVMQTGVRSLAWAGVIGSTWFVVRFFTFALAGKWTAWHYKIRWQIGPLVALAGSLAGMLLIHDLVALIAFQVVFGFSAAMLYSASLYYAMHVSSGHGGHAAFHEAVIGMGTLGGPLIAAVAATGQLDQVAMVRIAVSVSVLLGTGLAAIVWLATRDKAES